jgi:hypothetical protein
MWSWERDNVRPLALKAAAGGSPLIERYIDWAERVDDFEPLRVESDFDARVPDPRDPTRDLAGPDGEAVHYRGRIDALVLDADGGKWLLAHRLGPLSDSDALRLDESVVADAWAWEIEHLDVVIRGVLFNEITSEGRFRRVPRPLTREHIAAAGAQLGWEALAMFDPALVTYPTPAAHCADCAFVAPCLAMSEGGNPEPILAANYRARPSDEPVEGRLGGSTWSLGRGAAPPKFRDD